MAGTTSSTTTPNGYLPGAYVVTLAPGAGAPATLAAQLTKRYGGRVSFVYTHALHGFAVKGLNDRAAAALARNVAVKAITRDQQVRADGTQSSPPWGLDRIDQRALPLNASYTYNTDGSGVHAYDLDTGIRVTHADFKNADGSSRASVGADTVGDGQNGNDCNGHGTHTAGTIGSNTYGVAKKVQIVAVRVLDCQGSGSSAGIIAGIDWVTAHAIKPAVANMSLGTTTGTDSSIDSAVRNSIASGVTYALAAGNGFGNGLYQDNACSHSPSDVAEGLTVSATNSSDAKPTWANIGTCVDLFAPGVGVVSTYNTSDTATATEDGTSMATPHVTGAAALYLASTPSATPAQVASAINGNATTGKVSSPGSGTPNRLLYVGFIIGGGGGGNQAPTANFTSSCTALACSFTDTSTDTDGSIASRSWNFGDGGTSTTANPSHTYAAAGTYSVSLSVTDNGGASSSTSKSVTVSSGGGGGDPDPSTPNLTNGTPRSATSGASGGWSYSKINVPAGKSSLKVTLSWTQSCGLLSCSPDLDLYVRNGAKPTTSTYTCSSAGSANPETCTVSLPAGAYYYVGVYTYSGSASPYSVTATYS
jgi:subtilisin family serine protease